MKLILLLFVCLEIVLASVQHSRHQVAVKVTIVCDKSNCYPCYGSCEPAPDAVPETKEPVIQTLYPKRVI